jgi:hypothetical protein
MTEKSLAMGRLLSRRFRVSCLDYPSEGGCTLTLTGGEEEVLRAALLHAIDAHGHTDSPELRELIRASLKEVGPDRP